MNLFYDQRKVGRYEDENHLISTAYVPDGYKTYETAIASKLYIDSKGRCDEFCIVEAYDNKAEALMGHNKWVEMFKSDNLPDKLTDCKNSKIVDLLIPEEIIFTLKDKR